jgi:hypothetical protein
MSTEKRLGRTRKAFESWITRGWHKSFRYELKRKNVYGAYQNFDLQQAWHAFQAGWRRARR